jgi:DNA-binding response OmpR family regulator
MKKMKVLFVDDDASIRKFVRANLEARDYQVFLAADGEEALKIVESELPDLILLDIMMPKLDGMEVCQRIREWSKIPIIMLTARESENDKVKCLDCGADDYLTKPFSLRELLSRIKAVLRRTLDKDDTVVKPNYVMGDLEVDLLRSRVYISGQEINLTRTEYKILSYLVTNAGRVITPDQILGKVWGEEYCGDNHIVQVSMARLRKCLSDNGRTPRYIETRMGIGYMMKLPVLEKSDAGTPGDRGSPINL